MRTRLAKTLVVSPQINIDKQILGKNLQFFHNVSYDNLSGVSLGLKQQQIALRVRSDRNGGDRIISSLQGSGKRVVSLKSSPSSGVIYCPREDSVVVPNKRKERVDEEQSKKEDGSFVVPDNNAFGQSFRDYDESARKAIVEENYRLNHINQTYEFARNKKEEYGKLNMAEMTIWECVELLNEYVDESDPDLDEPQSEHLLQSAEAIRKDYPNQDWLHLTALVHDLGKVLLHPRFGEQPQWCVVGDTFPLGCDFDECIVYHKHFVNNPDAKNPLYSTKLGIYEENCGLEKVTMSWGHDEYMYMVMKGNKTTLPPAALFIVRFHSFYPLHKNGAYKYLMNEEDKEMLKWVNLFNKYDLYSKSKVRIDVEKVKPYYQHLIEKYFPARLKW